MSAAVVVDASIVAKWVLNERDSHEARRLLQSFVNAQTEIAVPPILLSELTQVFYTLVQQGLIEPEYSRTVLRDLMAQVTVHFTPELYERALLIAREMGLHRSYDAEYLALAIELEAEFWTADQTLYEASRGNFPFVRMLRRDSSIAQRK